MSSLYQFLSENNEYQQLKEMGREEVQGEKEAETQQRDSTLETLPLLKPDKRSIVPQQKVLKQHKN
jgi:hypothetical protein